MVSVCLELNVSESVVKGAQHSLALDKSEAQSLYVSVRLHRAACLAASVGNGAKPHIKMYRTHFLFVIWGGTTTPPHIDVIRRFY